MLVMRYAVLILSLIGAAACGALGAKWLSDINSPNGKLAVEIADSIASGKNDAELEKTYGPRLPELKELSAKLMRLQKASYALFGSVLLAIVGGVLALKSQKFLAALVLLVAGAGPAIFAPPALLATGVLLLSGLLSLLIPAPVR
jgi:hypothetical protein